MTERSWVTVVSGAPRSGTSLMMQMLAAGGLPVAVDGVRAADEDNPRGYFELEAVKRLRHDEFGDGFAALRGQAVKVVHLLLPHLPAEVECRVVYLRRATAEVVASQRLMLERRGVAADAVPAPVVAAALDRETARALDLLARRPRTSVLVVRYERLVADPVPSVEAVAEFLGGGLDEAAMRAAVDPALHRCRAQR